MIVSEAPNRAGSRWLQACVLLCAVVVLPLGLAYGQDYEAVGKRLKEAVEAGELTGVQARTMLAALKNTECTEKDQASERARTHLMNVRKELGAAVEAGKLSKEDAAKKIEAAEKAVKQRMAAGAYLMKVRKELGAAVEAGKISREDAAKKFEAAEKAIREKMAAGRGEGDSKRITPGDLARAGVEIRKAVAAGKLSAEEGRAKMEAMRKMVGQQSERGGDARPDWESIKRRIEGAVERGDMTREQADAKYREIKERMAGDHPRRISREDFGHVEAQLKKLVAEGKVSEEDARARLGAMRKRIGEQRQRDGERSGDDVEAWIKSIGERIKGAVKDGKLSEEEAWAKWLAIKEKEIGPKLKASVKAGVMTEEHAWAIWHGIERAEAAERLKAAVAKGEMTEEEARAKWAEIMEEDDDED